MVICRRGEAPRDSVDAIPARGKRASVSRAALASGLAVLGLLLSACASGADDAGGPANLTGQAEPAPDGPAETETDGESGTESGRPPPSSPAEDGEGDAGRPVEDGGTGTRCDSSGLSASVGANRPGAGKENYPLVVTNESLQPCVVYGYPGVAFVDSAGNQMGHDPERDGLTRSTSVILDSGQSAWAGLSFGNPDISGAHTAVPDSLHLTPPNETKSLEVAWTQGEVPVSGDVPTISAFRRGTGN
ncbi:DUF4232 domain-containing protein [Streptomyces sp. WMMC500]|uniref:DUF4232 domain-containing protein n=1 Tax=Streptomyces sp. WMMC500 TaxID=3015154 RepID=UPI00248B2FF5|nr:DUF4232 domain-containing protein [Streptomyces sp. WMMC500]WBB62010.1 DUF4232 domain-containing protein [Streptomyces sp. WMMC500]